MLCTIICCVTRYLLVQINLLQVGWSWVRHACSNPNQVYKLVNAWYCFWKERCRLSGAIFDLILIATFDSFEKGFLAWNNKTMIVRVPIIATVQLSTLDIPDRARPTSEGPTPPAGAFNMVRGMLSSLALSTILFRILRQFQPSFCKYWLAVACFSVIMIFSGLHLK